MEKKGDANLFITNESRLEHKEVLAISIRSASMILENGGETYRAEETATHTAISLGAKTATAFVTPTVVQVSYTDSKDSFHTAFRRVTRREVNLKKISRVNELSRRLAQRKSLAKPGQIDFVLSKIDTNAEYPSWFIILMGALSGFFFSFMFGGRLIDAVLSLCIGLGLRLFLKALEKIQLNSFIISLFSGAIVSIFVELIDFIPLAFTQEIILTATLMQVVPGLALVNAIRDLIAGDLLSGNARLVEAVMIAIGLSVGAVSGPLLFGGFL
ncbi:MAG TPA: threonine/serine exporter family protein [Treponemataceae bacterium]|nr:threonine/serine exporter family protein [Treponemataceae bacterium]HOQ92298.1 threonine/serine exporter family protein [Treponemataceae bacterium]HPM05869.1 threonine/serine exporter family protein [Treponemataceae bacterium]